MQALWDAALATLRQTLPSQAFDLWIRPLRPVALAEDVFDLGVPDSFFGEVVTERFRDALEKAVALAAGHPIAIRFPVVMEPVAAPAAPVAAPVAPPRSDTSLNPAYTFESFVVGSGNQFAHAACLAVGQGSGRTYNPLFLYGGVGLGKTHLINALGHAVRARKAGARICYVSAERFTNELISAIQNNKMPEFNNRYRNAADVLLVDDIQFIAGKERTQEAFFHTFNTLHAAGKQICLTSDRSPKEIAGLEERLRTRFECGLIADVQPPDMETKVAILKRKALSQGMALPDDVAIYLAEASSSNVRELEGFLTRIGAQAELTGRALTLEIARNALRELLPRRERELSVDDVVHVVANHFKVRVSDLKGARKLQAYTVPRQVAMYLARTCTKASFPEIGERFGGKDHSTVIHAVNRIKAKMEEDPDFRRTVEATRAALDV